MTNTELIKALEVKTSILFNLGFALILFYHASFSFSKLNC